MDHGTYRTVKGTILQDQSTRDGGAKSPTEKDQQQSQMTKTKSSNKNEAGEAQEFSSPDQAKDAVTVSGANKSMAATSSVPVLNSAEELKKKDQ
jgi:hypothetical protein